MTVPPIPPGYHSVTPYLIVRDAARALEFYAAAFGATEMLRLTTPDGAIAHAEFRIGDSIVMMGEEQPARGVHSPASLGGSPVSLMVYLPDADAAYARALAAGATVERPLADQFYGDRSGTVRDPFGHSWTLATHIEDVPPDEIDRRWAAITAG